MISETAFAKITELKELYKDNAEVLDDIERSIIDIEYIEKQEATGCYNGQPSAGYIAMLEAHLKYWN